MTKFNKTQRADRLEWEVPIRNKSHRKTSVKITQKKFSLLTLWFQTSGFFIEMEQVSVTLNHSVWGTGSCGGNPGRLTYLSNARKWNNIFQKNLYIKGESRNWIKGKHSNKFCWSSKSIIGKKHEISTKLRGIFEELTSAFPLTHTNMQK